MTAIEKAIAEIVAAQVEVVEQRIMERLALAQDRTLFFAEACEYLNMSLIYIERIVRAKGIPHRVVGADGSKNPRYLFRISTLNRWINNEEEQNFRPGGE